MFVNYHASDDSQTLDGIVRNAEPDFESASFAHLMILNTNATHTDWTAQWLKDGSGLMSNK